MNSKQFIIDSLWTLFEKYPFLTIQYKYDNGNLTHVVNIEPYYEFENNIEYQKEEALLSYKFDNEFFPESVLFISQNSLTTILDPEIVLSSKQFIVPAIIASYQPIYNWHNTIEAQCSTSNFALAA